MIKAIDNKANFEIKTYSVEIIKQTKFKIN